MPTLTYVFPLFSHVEICVNDVGEHILVDEIRGVLSKLVKIADDVEFHRADRTSVELRPPKRIQVLFPTFLPIFPYLFLQEYRRAAKEEHLIWS